MPAGAWGEKPSAAIRAPPKPGSQESVSAAGTGSSGRTPSSSSGAAFTTTTGGRSNINKKRQGPTGGDRPGSGRGTGTATSGRGRGRSNNHHHSHPSPHANSNSNANQNSQQYHRTILNVELLLPGEGQTPIQKQVKRYTAASILQMRLNFLDMPSSNNDTTANNVFNPPPHCAWIEDNRIEEIHKIVELPSKLGDVSKIKQRTPSTQTNANSNKETAPPLDECTPLVVNDATRWKSKVFSTDTATTATATIQSENTTDSTSTSSTVPTNDTSATNNTNDSEVLKKALLILNKLSLTKFDKLAQKFLDTGIGQTPARLQEAVHMIVEKAQSEPHFSSMYAQLCLFLTNNSSLSSSSSMMNITEGATTANATTATTTTIGKNKAFKKLLLSRCQAEFEVEMSSKIAKAVEGINDPEERAYQEGIIKKKYLGHMRFIGELYKGDLIKLEIMLFCLQTLLEGSYEEEKIECFAKLITTVGFPLEQQSASMAQVGKSAPQEKLNACWKKVDDIISEAASARIKFMLLDLKEMRDNGWITRRKEEKVMTIHQIHMEVAKEEAHAARRSSSSRGTSLGGGSSNSLGMRRSTSDLRRSQVSVDHDGFVSVMSTSRSSASLLTRATSDVASSFAPTMPNPPKPVRRAQSFNVAPSKSSLALRAQTQPPPQPSPPKTTALTSVEPPSVTKTGQSMKEIEKKTHAMLKEYYMCGDLNEALTSMDEIVGGEKDDAEERCTKMVEACVMLVMEGKPEDVDKMLIVLKAAYEKKGLVVDQSFVKGLEDPLEFLSDIEIDAPSARKFLSKIVAEFATMVTAQNFESAKQRL